MGLPVGTAAAAAIAAICVAVFREEAAPLDCETLRLSGAAAWCRAWRLRDAWCLPVNKDENRRGIEPNRGVLEMHEPLGRLGDIVRRMKRMTPPPPPRVAPKPDPERSD
jgi:hypothetical protein